MNELKMLWNLLTIVLAVIVVVALTGPWGLAAVVVLGVAMAVYRALAVERSRRRMVAARAQHQAALEVQRVAERELAQARERAAAAGWYVPRGDYSLN